MSRAEYSDELDNQELNLWRGAVASAIRGKRGQAFLRETLAALDAMEDKRLITEELASVSGQHCALGVVGTARGMDLDAVEQAYNDEIAKAFGVAEALVREIEYENDEGGKFDETPERRWERMRSWVLAQLEGEPQ